MITREQLDKKTRITLMALKTYQTRTFLTVLQRQSQERLILENNFRKDFIKLVREYEEKVLYTYTSSTMKGLSNHNIIVLLRIANQDFKEKYNKLLYKHLLLVEKNARNQTDELIKLQMKKRVGQKQEQISFKDQPLTWLSQKAKDIQTKLLPNKKNKPYVVRENKKVKQYLRDHALTVSQKTAERIDKNIQEILTRSETEGTNSRGVAKHITQKFKQLKTWEAERIARTEINAANNLVTHNRLLENGLVDYKQWVSAEDSRVRKSHKKLNTEIARIGEPFSNGLMYPGDHNGPLEEFINCRCTLVPYIPDFDKIAPTDMTTWHEEDMQRLPTNTGQQIILQLNEQQKLYKVMDGYMKLYPDKITLKPGNVQTTLDRLINKLPLDYHTKTQTMYKTPTSGISQTEKLLLNPEEKEVYKKLKDKLEKAGGKITVEKGKVKIEGKGLKFKEKNQLKKLHAKQNNIQTNTVDKESNVKAIEKQKKERKDISKQKQEKENKIKLIQQRENDLHGRFRRENPKISQKMDEWGFRHGEHYHYLQDENGKVYIEWYSKGDTNRKDLIDKYYTELVPDNELYGNKYQKQAVIGYTNDQFRPFNAMYRYVKQMKQIGRYREEIIKLGGEERWNKVLKFYKNTMNKLYDDFLDKGGHLEDFFYTRKAYKNKSYKLKMNTRLYHGQSRWYGNPPKVGHQDTLGQYLSTSHDLDVAEDYAIKGGNPINKQVIIEIDAPKCIKAMHIINRGGAGNESEFLLRYDQEFEITKVFTGDDGRMHVRYKLLGEVC